MDKKTSRGLMRRHAQYNELLERHRRAEARARRSLASAIEREHERGTPYNVIAADFGVSRQRIHQMANENGADGV